MPIFVDGTEPMIALLFGGMNSPLPIPEMTKTSATSVYWVAEPNVSALACPLIGVKWS